jgi:photosystem II stability/assembly factor-like uncharacterized protein
MRIPHLVVLPPLALTCLLPAQAPGESQESQRRLEWFATHQKMAASSPHAARAWQFVGPVRMRGRLTDIEAHPSAPKTILIASASGGVFKTTDEGKTWKAVFTDQATASIGDLAIAPADPKQVWVGTGEANILRSSMAGTGIYKSTDGGDTFTHAGLGDTQHISRIVVHPTDPNIVYAASAGHEYTHDKSRGIYKTIDGGKTWRHVYFENVKTGVIDLAIDPEQPDILYATTAERLRYRWNDPKPGPQAGLIQSTDGGETWWRPVGGDLPDFTAGEYERIGIDICRGNPKTLYLALHRAKGRRRGAEVFRSNDRGKSWKMVDGRNGVRRVFPTFGWFFGQVRVDPNDADTVFVLGQSFVGTKDGGKTWRRLRGTHVDFHAMWINPKDSKHVLVGNDGGLMISHDGFESYDAPRNIPMAQCYNCGVSQKKGKFYIYCSVQDHGAWRGAVDVTQGRDKIERQQWSSASGDEAGRHAVDPKNPGVVYSLRRYGGGPSRTDYGESSAEDAGSGQRRRRGRGQSVAPRFPPGERKRAQWVSPLIISAHGNERLLYGAQFVFLTDDGGKEWKKISPDLTNFHPDRQGNIAHAIVFCIAESPVEKGVIYAGTDDGNIQVTRDEGKTWKNVNKGIPEGRCISSLCASAFDKGTVFATVSGKRHDDFGCYIFKSTDYGETWKSIAASIPGSSANVIKQDPKKEGLLFVGTDRGVYVTTNDGAEWHVLGKSLPTVYVHDLVIQTKEDFLVIATHGRGCYVIDVRDLRQ